jgi:predicted nucleotidyltransferase
MKSITQLNLKENEKKALQELTEKLSERLPEVEIILYGSKARDDSEAFSDIDVLVLLDREVNNSLEEEIFSIAYELELDVVFGILVESKVFWNSDLAHAMPIHWNIDREGIMI